MHLPLEADLTGVIIDSVFNSDICQYERNGQYDVSLSSLLDKHASLKYILLCRCTLLDLIILNLHICKNIYLHICNIFFVFQKG